MSNVRGVDAIGYGRLNTGGWWAQQRMRDPMIDQNYRFVEDFFNSTVASKKLYDSKQIEEEIQLARNEFELTLTGGNDREEGLAIFDEIAGAFLAGSREREMKVDLGSFGAVASVFFEEINRQIQRQEYSERLLENVYQACRARLAQRARPDLESILDDIYLGSLAKLRAREARSDEELNALFDKYAGDPREGPVVVPDSQILKRERSGAALKQLEQRAGDVSNRVLQPSETLQEERVRADIASLDTVFNDQTASIARMQSRLDGPRCAYLAHMKIDQFREVIIAAQKRSDYTNYYREQASACLERGDLPSARRMSAIFSRMVEALAEENKRIHELLDQAEGDVVRRVDSRFDALLNIFVRIEKGMEGNKNQIEALSQGGDDEVRRRAYAIGLMLERAKEQSGSLFAFQNKRESSGGVMHDLQEYIKRVQELDNTIQLLLHEYEALFPEKNSGEL